MIKKVLVKKIVLVAILILLLTCIIYACGESVYSRGSKFLDDYSEYIVFRKNVETRPLFGVGGAVSGDRLWFLPGQKSKMLSKIKQDIHAELTEMVENNRDLFKGYEINDDFRKVYVYYYKDARNYDLNPKSTQRIDRLSDALHRQTVVLKIELIDELIHGYANSEFSESIVDMVELDEQMPA